eukprot:scpid82122/ scgid25611/ 
MSADKNLSLIILVLSSAAISLVSADDGFNFSEPTVAPVISSTAYASNFSCWKASCSDVAVKFLNTPTCPTTEEICVNSTTCISTLVYPNTFSASAETGEVTISLGCARADQLSGCHKDPGTQKCDGTTCVTCCDKSKCNTEFSQASLKSFSISLLMIAAFVQMM